MVRPLAIALAVCLASLPLTAIAQDAMIYAHGTRTCAQWSVERRGNGASNVTLQVWVAGAISGISMERGRDVLGTFLLDDAVAWIDDYCGRHPSHKVARAVGELVVEMEDRRQTLTRR